MGNENVYRYFLWALAREYWQAQGNNEELGSPGTIERFNTINDLSILKVIKLNFLAVAMSLQPENEEHSIYNNYFRSFRALQYGPVEMNFWDFLQETTPDDTIYCDFDSTQINLNDQSFLAVEEELRNNCEEEASGLSTRIDRIIEIMRQEHRVLFTKNANTLVDITHKWDTWKIPFRKAKFYQKKSYPIELNDFQHSPVWS